MKGRASLTLRETLIERQAHLLLWLNVHMPLGISLRFPLRRLLPLIVRVADYALMLLIEVLMTIVETWLRVVIEVVRKLLRLL